MSGIEPRCESARDVSDISHNFTSFFLSTSYPLSIITLSTTKRSSTLSHTIVFIVINTFLIDLFVILRIPHIIPSINLTYFLDAEYSSIHDLCSFRGILHISTTSQLCFKYLSYDSLSPRPHNFDFESWEQQS